MSSTPTEQSHDPVFSVIDLGAETKRMLGPEFSAPEVAYIFDNGRRVFKMRTGDAAIYASSPDFTG